MSGVIPSLDHQPSVRHPIVELRQLVEEPDLARRQALGQKWVADWLARAVAVAKSGAIQADPKTREAMSEKARVLQQLAIEIALTCCTQSPGRAAGTTELSVVALRSVPNG